jgi:hypothetical protein
MHPFSHPAASERRNPGADPMPKLAETATPLLNAALSTGASVLAFAMLRTVGAGADVSLLSSMILAGLLNIRRLASLNCEALLPTCQPSVGELSR